MPRNALLNFLQSASNEAAGAVSGPVDLLGMGLRGLGVPVPRNALLSSEWMAERGLMRPVQQGASQVAGATAGLLSPVAAAAKAPQIAAGLLQAGRNMAAPATMSRGPMGLQLDQVVPAVEKARSEKGMTADEPRLGCGSSLGAALNLRSVLDSLK